jgi:hypothetical protein
MEGKYEEEIVQKRKYEEEIVQKRKYESSQSGVVTHLLKTEMWGRHTFTQRCRMDTHLLKTAKWDGHTILLFLVKCWDGIDTSQNRK